MNSDTAGAEGKMPDAATGVLPANTHVRLIHDPGREGYTTGRTRERRGSLLQQVRFNDGMHSYFPSDQLEVVSVDGIDPIEYVQRGLLGSPSELVLTLTHIRLTGRLAEMLYSMDSTGTDFYAYQFKPVVKLLNSATSGILIADEVGLGKTIESGLIWTELRSRFDYRRLLVLCPAALREKWRVELERRFGVHAVIASASEAIEILKRASNPGDARGFAIIASKDGWRPRKGWQQEDDRDTKYAANRLARYLEERRNEDPLIDLCIVDEAHYLRNQETSTAALGRLLRGVSGHVVLLSATPIHLRSEDLYQLVNIIDPDTFNNVGAFQEVLSANQPLVTLRQKILAGGVDAQSVRDELDRASRHRLLTNNRQLKSVRAALPDSGPLRDQALRAELAQRVETANLLGHVITRTRKRDVHEWRVRREIHAEEVVLSEPERRFYDAVTETVRQYAMLSGAHEGFLQVTPQRQVSSSMPAALRDWQQSGGPAGGEEEVEGFDIEFGEEQSRDLPGPLRTAIMQVADELADLDELWELDSKYRGLRRRLVAFFESNPNEKVVLFSYFRPTLDYLSERLREDGVANLVLKGGIDSKDSVLAEFRDSSGPLVLLSSEVGAEGLDLQFAWALINYDLPWNPMRIEQRIGRIDRLGQQSPKVAVWNVFCADTIDSRIYHRLYERLGLFEGAFGGMEAVLGEKAQNLAHDLLRNDLTPAEEEERIKPTEQALANIRSEEERLQDEAPGLVAYGDYILTQVQAARDMNRSLHVSELFRYVQGVLEKHYAGCEFLQDNTDSDIYDIRLSPEASHALERFVRERRVATPTRLTHRGTRGVRYRFSTSVVESAEPGIEVVNQFHPLMRFASYRIQEDPSHFHPSVAVTLSHAVCPEGIPAGHFAFSVARWSFRGVREIEKIDYAVTPLDRSGAEPLSLEDQERLVVAAGTEGIEWTSAAAELDLADAARVINDVCLGESDERYESYRRRLLDENADRAEQQERTLDQQEDRQIATLEEVLRGHASKGRSSLVKATEGRIKATRDRFEVRRLSIRERRQMRASRDEVCVGVIRVIPRAEG